jgi:hypothetical protein
MVDIKWGNVEVRKWNYMCHKYSNSNYGSHTQAIMIGGLTLFFSYDTIVGFQWRGKEYYMVNDFSRTTGKHLNILCPDKKKRIKPVEFTKLLNAAMHDFKWKMVLEK